MELISDIANDIYTNISEIKAKINEKQIRLSELLEILKNQEDSYENITGNEKEFINEAFEVVECLAKRKDTFKHTGVLRKVVDEVINYSNTIMKEQTEELGSIKSKCEREYDDNCEEKDSVGASLNWLKEKLDEMLAQIGNQIGGESE